MPSKQRRVWSQINSTRKGNLYLAALELLKNSQGRVTDERNQRKAEAWRARAKSLPTPQSGHFRATATCPNRDLARKHRALYFPSSRLEELSHSFIRHLQKVTLTCSNGCPATILKNLSSPSRRPSITSSENRLVKTFPGSGGILTRVDSRSRMSRKASKSE